MEIKEKKPLVSIIMNCFNGELFLRDAIESLINQTYDNWELIFWDNKSTDFSAKIFKSFNDKRFKYYYSDKHTSLYEARNLAIEKTNSEYIAFLDTDDLWINNKLEIQMKCFDNEDVGLVFSNYWIMNKKLKNKKIYTHKKLPNGAIYEKLLDVYSVGILTVIMRKKFFLKLEKKFDGRFSIIGDFDLFLRLSKICIFKSIQIPLAFYRLHGSNLSIVNNKTEINEMGQWLEENKSNLNIKQFNKIKKVLFNQKFINYKIEREYSKCINVLFNSGVNILSVKNFIILFTPVFLLKNFLWYYQD